VETLVDARGLGCPQPVICTKKALENLQSGVLTTIVDNEVAMDNVIRLAKTLDYPVEVEKKDQSIYIKIKKEMDMLESLESQKGSVVLISSEFMGKGSDELGRLLCKSFFFALTEMDTLPQAIIFLNSGVKLTCEASDVLGEIILLEKKGVEILSCGTCLDYFKLKDRLCVGEISNMYSIAERLLNSITITI
jgi:selenium metabolism protein YedF